MRPPVRRRGGSRLRAALLVALAAGTMGAGLPSHGAAGERTAAREQPFRVRAYDLVPGGRGSGQGIAYGMHRDGQRPGGPSPTREQITEDLKLLAPRWPAIRVYGALEPTETVLQVIRDEKLPLHVLLGVWIDSEQERDSTAHAFKPRPAEARANRAQMDAAVRLARRYPAIVNGLCVGNETQVSWSSHRVPEALLVRYLREARARTRLPVSTADDFNFWNKPESRTLALECDFIVLHAHPLWNGQQVRDGVAWTKQQLAQVRALHPGRPVVLGETGWATMRDTTGDEARYMKGELSEDAQAEFLDSLTAWVASEHVPVFVFEAFDENWKGGDRPHEVEKHWGLYRADRTPKRAVSGQR
jgi:exo-beta-1,3-glucanase (GH17 family)